MVDFVPAERANAIREPSTANFLIDSEDRTVGTGAGLFTISKGQSLLNGFFTRLGITEVSVKWAVPNVVADNSNNWVFMDVSGASTTSSPIVQILPGTYSASDFLNTFVAAFNAIPSASRSGVTLAVTSTGGNYTLAATNGQFRFPTVLNASRVISGFFTLGPTYNAFQTKATSSSAPGVGLQDRFFTSTANIPQYLDFVCRELTYNQSLKDATTNLSTDRDVMCRFYLAYDNDMTQVDSLGFPLLMTYKPFCIRRQFTPPKQIRWTANQPVGSVSFEVYDDKGNLYNPLGWEWRMTIQVSEV